MSAKARLFQEVLQRLKQGTPYVRSAEVAALARELGLEISESTLPVYLSEAMATGLIHDAGRGWYSSLANAFELDAWQVKPLVTRLKKKFPLLDFTCWSTGQVRAFGHHLLARFVSFVHTDRDAMSSVAGFLKDGGYDVHLNPRAEAARQFTIRDRTVVVRPKNSAQPHDDHQVAIEGLLVELFVESRALNLMDASECCRIFANLAGQARISMATLLDYARERRPAALGFIELINGEFTKKSA
jgi:hypothetical protein